MDVLQFCVLITMSTLELMHLLLMQSCEVPFLNLKEAKALRTHHLLFFFRLLFFLPHGITHKGFPYSFASTEPTKERVGLKDIAAREAHFTLEL